MRVVVVVALVLAGCSAEPDQQDLVIVDSQETETVDGGTPAATGDGILRGTVVDEALFVVAGATVRLPGPDLSRLSDSRGEFAFDSLLAGEYLVQADAKGYQPAQADVIVAADKPTVVQFQLRRNPPEDPYHTTLEFQGHGEYVSSWTFGLLGTECAPCEFQVLLDAPADTLIVEAARTTGGGAGMGFEMMVRDSGGHQLAHEFQGDPSWLRVDEPAGTTFYVQARPDADYAPEPNTDFEVFVTSFHNDPAPEAWSYLEGDP